MIRTFIVAIAVVGVVAAAVPDADARPRPRRGSKFQSNKTFGLGFMIGAPTAIAGKYYLDSDTAVDFGVGVYYRYRDRDGLHVHADYLIHPVNLVETPDFWLPLYLGVGGRFLDTDNDGRLGVRIPVGISLDFTNVPLDVFFELAFVLDLIVGGDDGLDADIGPALGIRYYFE